MAKNERDANGRLKKGSTANPNGRPKKDTSITELVRKKAELEISPGKTYADAIAEKLLELAAAGDMTAIKYYADRTDGTPKQTQEINLAANVSIDTEFELVDPDEVPQDLDADTEET